MCLPAAARPAPISRCRKLGAVTLTAWTRGSPARSRQSRVAVAKPYRAAACAARPGASSATAINSGRRPSCGKWCGIRAYDWVCTRPIHPKPATATPIESVMTTKLRPARRGRPAAIRPGDCRRIVTAVGNSRKPPAAGKDQSGRGGASVAPGTSAQDEPGAIPAEFGPDANNDRQAVTGSRGASRAGNHVPTSPELVADAVISRPLRERIALGDGPIGVVAELRLRYPDGLPGARQRVQDLLEQVRPGAGAAARLTSSYVTAAQTAGEIRELVRRDSRAAEDESSAADGPGDTVRATRDAIYRLWPNFGTSALITRSIITTKCQAVHRSFNATG